MSKTRIEWADATWNPSVGCSKVTAACKNCYAEKMHKRLTAMGVEKYAEPFNVVKLVPDELDKPMRWRKPRRIFVDSMSDLFHEDLSFNDMHWVWLAMDQDKCRQHEFLILTKRPEAMLHYLEFRDMPPLPNVHLGVSIHDQKSADYAIPLLLQTPAAVRFVSYEPALGPVDFSPWLPRPLEGFFSLQFEHLDHVIMGGESGPGARPMHPQWARDVQDQCEKSGTSFLFKQWGEYRPSTVIWSSDEFESPEFDPAEDHLSHQIVTPEGQRPNEGNCWPFGNDALMVRVGKKKAGRLLDGVLYDEYPRRTT